MCTFMLRSFVTGYIEYTFIVSGLVATLLPQIEAGDDLVLKVSKEKVSWYTAIQSGHGLVNEDFVSKHGDLESITKNIPEDERFWIAARAKYTPFVSWEGCVRWTGDSGCEYRNLSGGSIGDCLMNCSMDDHFFMLEGTECRCVSERNKDACVRQSTDRCDEACPNNPNDWCGGQKSSMALYYTGPFGINDTTTEKNGENEMNCVLFGGHRARYKDGLGLQISFCNSQVRRYICGGRYNATSVDNTAYLTWLQALSLCNRSNQHLYYKLHGGFNNRIMHWTSVRRSFILNWTNERDESFPFCVSVSRDNASRLFLYEDICERNHSYLAFQFGDADNGSGLTFLYYLISAAIFTVVIATIAGLLCRCIATRLKQPPVNNIRECNLNQQPSSVRLNPPSSRVYSENRGYVFMEPREEARNSDMAVDNGRGTDNEVPTDIYHTIDDAKTRSVYNTDVRKERPESLIYVDGAIGKALNENESGLNDHIYNDRGTYLTVVDQTAL